MVIRTNISLTEHQTNIAGRDNTSSRKGRKKIVISREGLPGPQRERLVAVDVLILIFYFNFSKKKNLLFVYLLLYNERKGEN